jgi:hypothetical protein
LLADAQEHLGGAPAASATADHGVRLEDAYAIAAACYGHALALNPHFAAGFADDARARLSRLRG